MLPPFIYIFFGIAAIPFAGFVGWALGSIYTYDHYHAELIKKGIIRLDWETPLYEPKDK